MSRMRFVDRLAGWSFLVLTSFGLGCRDTPAGPHAVDGGSAVYDVAYDGVYDPERALDVYSPPPRGGGALAPVVVWVHGGGWKDGDKKNQIGDKIDFFNGEGYVFVSINYRLSPEPSASPNPARVKYPVHEQDVAQALVWITQHAAEYGGDATRLAILGHSAGAHLVALVGTDPQFIGKNSMKLSQIRCVGSFDTEGYDVSAAISGGSSDQVALYTNAFGDDPSVWAEASPLRHVTAGAGIGSFLIVKRGTDDRAAGETAFRDALTQADVRASLIDASDLSHADVNAHIGMPGDTVMTPPIRDFLRTCFL